MEHNYLFSPDPEILEENNFLDWNRRHERWETGPVDDIFGLGKRGKKKRAAKKAAKRAGISGKEARRIGRAAGQQYRAEQLIKKGKTKKAARVLSREGQTAVGRGLRTVAAWTVLLPFRAGMKKALQRKGIAPPDKMRDLAPLFYKEVVKKDSYEVGSYDSVIDYFQVPGQQRRVSVYPDIYDNEFDNVAPAIPIAAIIKAIIDYFKGKKKDKEDGKTLSPVGEIVASAAMNVTTALQEKQEQQAIAKGMARTPTELDKQTKANMELMEPLRGMMAGSLRQKGVTPEKDIRDLTIQFYNRVVAAGNNTYDGIDNADGDEEKKSVLFSTIVPAVTGFLGALKAKAQAGEPLSKTEDFIVRGTQKVETGIRQGIVQRGQLAVGQTLLSPGMLMMVGLVIVAVIFASRKG